MGENRIGMRWNSLIEIFAFGSHNKQNQFCDNRVIIVNLAIPKHTRAKRVGTWHGFGHLVVMLRYSLNWLVCSSAPGYTLPFLALALSFLGFAVAGVTTWLGGELVKRLGVGVDPDAHIGAPSFLAPSRRAT
jgi:hypothetical protein